MTFALAMAFTASMFLSAQDAQAILDQHFEAVGQENLLKANTIQASGKAMQMGMEFPFNMIQKRPDKLKLVIEVQGSQIIQAVNGENVWAVNPMTGSADPIDLTGPEADALKENADLDGQLWNRSVCAETDQKERQHRLFLCGSGELPDAEGKIRHHDAGLPG